MAEASTDKLQKKEKIRFLKVLSKNRANELRFFKSDSQIALKTGDQKFAFGIKLVAECEKENLVITANGLVQLTEAGKSHLIRALHPETGFTVQHAGDKKQSVNMNGVVKSVPVNENESPLSRLYLRKARDGSSWINDEEFQAGERLRTDFEKSQLQPRISANWVASVAANGRGGNASADVSDFAIDARIRVEAAMASLGPDLANVALDICCFLKGLEAIERERFWPPRSAKLMLRTALRELARHYGFTANRVRSARSQKLSHWGVDDFRPTL